VVLHKYNKLTCLFGHHDHSKRLTKDKDGNPIYLCKICKRSGYRKCNDGTEVWDDYDEKGNLIHERWNDGSGFWKANNGGWVKTKPKNWKYENTQ